MTSVPSGSVRNGTTTSSTSMPMRSFAAIALGQPALDPHLVTELHHARPRRAGTSPCVSPPAYGSFGRNSWVVNVHSVPRRGSRCCSTAVAPHRAHDGCTGNVTAPHSAHRPPMSCGSSAGHVKTSSANACWAMVGNLPRGSGRLVG